MKRTLNLFLCTRSFVVGHSNEAVSHIYVAIEGSFGILSLWHSFKKSPYFDFDPQMSSNLFISTLSLCGRILWLAPSLHSNERLTWCMSSLSVVWRATALWNSSLGGKKFHKTPLAPSPPRFPLIYGRGGVGFWCKVEREQECRNKLSLGNCMLGL